MQRAILLVGGELCRRVASRLDHEQWMMWGLRRTPVVDDGIRWLAADLAEPASLHGLPHDISHVLYAPSPDARDAASYRAVYPHGLEHLFDALPDPSRLQRFVLVGSTAVWPPTDIDHAMAWIDETQPAIASNFRSEELLAAERVLHKRLPEQGVVLRLGGIYGPGRTRLIDSLRSGRLIAPAGVGHWSNRIHIEDAASACRHVLGLSDTASCYIGTDGQPTDKATFYDALADLMNVPHPQRQVTPPSGKRLSNSRLIDSGWTPRWSNALAGYQALLADMGSAQSSHAKACE